MTAQAHARGATASSAPAAAADPADAVPTPAVVRAGALSATIAAGAVRWVHVGDVEVVRAIDYPIRDANWGTLTTRTEDETLDETGDGFVYRRRFSAAGDNLTGTFALEGRARPLALSAALELTAAAPVVVNRAGLVLLHPLAGVAGTPLERTAPDGTRSAHAFPELIAPVQPVQGIAGLAHVAQGVPVRIAFSGDVFEMEDQRNWTDASFKTYCRPLSLPRPYRIEPGERVTQRIAIALAAAEGEPVDAAEPASGVAPEVMLALEQALSPLTEAAVAALAAVPLAGVQLRLRPEGAAAALEEARSLGRPVDLEVVIAQGDAPGAALSALAAACVAAGIAPRRVVALPEGYLRSVQPEGPWPEGATPAEAADAVRAAFPDAQTGGGVLTNFTELNRCRPAFACSYVTFGTTAIVHAADDASVVETLEALPAVFATAAAIAGGRPLRLGLTAIAMRSNPYGAAVAQNVGALVAMAMDDPRHATSFAATFAVGVAAAAARARVASLSPAMATGPLGLVRQDGRVHPLFHVVAVLAGLAGREVSVAGRVPGGLVRLAATGACGLAANLSGAPVRLDEAAALVPDAAGDANWLALAAPVRGLVLPPMGVAVLWPEAAR